MVAGCVPRFVLRRRQSELQECSAIAPEAGLCKMGVLRTRLSGAPVSGVQSATLVMQAKVKSVF